MSGDFSIGLDGRGQPFEITGEYLEVDPPRLLVSTWIATWTGDIKSRIRWELEPLNQGTRVTLRHSGLASSRTGAELSWVAKNSELVGSVRRER